MAKDMMVEDGAKPPEERRQNEDLLHVTCPSKATSGDADDFESAVVAERFKAVGTGASKRKVKHLSTWHLPNSSVES